MLHMPASSLHMPKLSATERFNSPIMAKIIRINDTLKGNEDTLRFLNAKIEIPGYFNEMQESNLISFLEFKRTVTNDIKECKEKIRVLRAQLK